MGSVLSFFHPDLCRNAQGATYLNARLKEFVMDVLSKVNPDVGNEMEKWSKSPVWPTRQQTAIPGVVTIHVYKQWLELFRPKFPAIVDKVIRILEVSPTEASVERAFSHLKFTVPHLRSRTAAANVRAQLIVNSYERLVQKVVPPITQSTTNCFRLPMAEDILKAFAKTELPAAFTRAIKTRGAGETCQKCGKKLNAHTTETKAYVMCNGAECRERGAKTNFICAGFSATMEAVTINSVFHAETYVYTCPPCEAAAAAAAQPKRKISRPEVRPASAPRNTPRKAENQRGEESLR